MNRRQKIIVSVTGIFLVLLLLVGLTYAYFLTQITGNTNDKSISVSTANLAVVYGGDDSSIIGEGETIIPGNTFAPKTFTVTNQGNATTDYVVVIEILEGTSTFESNDFTYTLTCTSGCNGVDTATTFPIEGGILVGNSIDVEETQTYAFTLTYEETGKNQTNDMNKKLEARINIKDIRTENPYKNNRELLSYNIINNAANGVNGTKLRAVPLTAPGNFSLNDEALLTMAEDDYGHTYYYRGNVQDNYLNFGGMCWRIVRIDGNGNIKIVLADENNECDSTGFNVNNTSSAFITNNGSVLLTEYNSSLSSGEFLFNFSSSNVLSVLNPWLNGETYNSMVFSEKLSLEEKNNLVLAEWCNDVSMYKFYEDTMYANEYSPNSRLNSPSFKCDFVGINETSSTIFENNIGILTSDEVIFAGRSNSNYLYQNANGNAYWTMSPAWAESAWYFMLAVNKTSLEQRDTGGVAVGGDLPAIRPSLVLSSSVTLNSGDGSISNPYTIK